MRLLAFMRAECCGSSASHYIFTGLLIPVLFADGWLHFEEPLHSALLLNINAEHLSV